VPNGIDVERFRPGTGSPDWKARLGPETVPLVTYLGRLTVDKGVHRFLDAVRLARRRIDLRAVVAGTGPEESAVRRRIAEDPELASGVSYLGAVCESEKPALLAQSDLFVLPSTSDTSSIALLEAMACGTPVIAPDRGGPAEIVDEGVTGWKAPATDPAAIAELIERTLDDAAARHRVGRRATEFVQRTASLDTMARRFISLYQLAEERRTRRDFSFPTGAGFARPTAGR